MGHSITLLKELLNNWPNWTWYSFYHVIFFLVKNIKTESSSSQLPTKHDRTMLGMKRFFWFTICLIAVLVLCLLYFPDTWMTNSSPISAIGSLKEVPGYLFGNEVNKLNDNNEFNSLMNTMREQDDSRNSVNKRRREAEKSEISRRLQDFQHDWLRQRRARVDWENIIKPCVDNMVWGLVKDHWGKTNRSNATTSDIMFKDIRPAGEFSKIFIQSKTSDNRTKLIGGDTWRVYVRGPASIAATVFDHNNGTYEALFLITEPGVYQLMIYLDYSLCDGFKDPPRDWFIIGDAQGYHQRDGVLGPLDEHLVKQSFNYGQPALTINVIKAQLKDSLSGK